MRIYYTTDLHGSEKCWRKFLVTPKYYKADIIMVGGDITGKFIVPIIHLPNGRWEATFMGIAHKMKKQRDVDDLKQLIANAGQYSVDMDQSEYDEYKNNPETIEGLFTQTLMDRVKQWMDMADEKLQGQNVRCFIAAGNDDIFEVDQVIAASKLVEHHDGKVFESW